MTGIVVVSADPARRRDWASVFESGGQRVAVCSGPLIGCPLARGETGCLLLDESDVAVYDLDSVTPTLLPLLVRLYRHRTLLFARDTQTPGGRHRPSIVRLASPSRGRACFGDF